MTSVFNKVAGCIVGGAIGDCLGAPYEGRPVDGPIPIPPAATITDDTALTLATCMAIMDNGRPDPAAIATTFREWFTQGRVPRPGSSTLKALRDLSHGCHWGLSGASGEMSAGNGAAMRIAPLAFCIDPSMPEGRNLVYDVASITHRNDEAASAALAIALAVHAPDFNFIPLILDALPDSITRDRLWKIQSGNFSDITDFAAEYGAGGFAAASIPLALFAASKSPHEEIGFYESICSVIRCGGDSDTNSSLTGQIIGSKIGLSEIPDNLKSLKFTQEPVVDMAISFARWIEKNI